MIHRLIHSKKRSVSQDGTGDMIHRLIHSKKRSVRIMNGKRREIWKRYAEVGGRSREIWKTTSLLLLLMSKRAGLGE